jgi:predicted TIM-barrel fold metal-dependent hydrolase
VGIPHLPRARASSALFRSGPLAQPLFPGFFLGPGCNILAASLGVVLALAGCQTNGPKLTAEQKQIRKDLEHVSPWGDSLAKNSPIIDIHTHTFNARYLPLRNIVLGKRDAFPPITWLISDSCADTLAHALIERTELAAAAGQPDVARRDLETQSYEHRDQGIVCGVFLGLLDKAAARGCWDKDLSPKERLDRLDQVAKEMNMQQRMAVMAAAHMMGMQDQVRGREEKTDGMQGMAREEKTDGLRGAVRFLWFLTQNDADMPRLFSLQYEGVPMRDKSPLMVSHMMDLGPVYDQHPSGTELLDFEKKQVPRMAEFQSRPGSHMIYFVAYNPYRDYWDGQNPGRARELVRSAIDEHGAWGVKVYPPSGYRPIGNQIKGRPTGIRSRIAGQQWDAHYGHLPGDKNRALDKNLEELLLWCIKKDVPVFVHAGTGEFEAQKGYGFYHSDPSFWRDFLKDHPTLRLCLGHAGGADYWFGGGKASGWGQLVYELCRTYPNVYCEITTHAELVSANRQAYFVDRLAKSFDDSQKQADKPYKYSFGKKLIYGTDWYLPDASDRDTVLLATQRAFLHKKLRRHYKDYFFGNALRYLKAEGKLKGIGDSTSSIDKKLAEAPDLVGEEPAPAPAP